MQRFSKKMCNNSNWNTLVGKLQIYFITVRIHKLETGAGLLTKCNKHKRWHASWEQYVQLMFRLNIFSTDHLYLKCYQTAFFQPHAAWYYICYRFPNFHFSSKPTMRQNFQVKNMSKTLVRRTRQYSVI